MHTKEQVQLGLDEARRQYGEWQYDIPLPFDIWTRGNLKIAHTRLRRIVQIASDLSRKPIAECRVLDLGCLDGLFSIEFALQGAETVGVEVRDTNVKRAEFCKNAHGLKNLEFRQDDARNISAKAYGKFDVIVCSGLLYHLPAADAANLIKTMHEMSNRLVIIDTQVALSPNERISHENEEYWGTTYVEHSEKATPEQKAKNLMASADNNTSFWFTRPSLINLLSKTGFSSVYEGFVPTHLEGKKSGELMNDRCTFVAVKDETCQVITSPRANSLKLKWPEKSLTYVPQGPLVDRAKSLAKRVLRKYL